MIIFQSIKRLVKLLNSHRYIKNIKFVFDKEKMKNVPDFQMNSFFLFLVSSLRDPFELVYKGSEKCLFLGYMQKCIENLFATPPVRVRIVHPPLSYI